MARQIIVDLIADSSKFTRGTREATSAAESFSSRVKSSVFAGVGLGAGVGAWNMVTAAVGKAIDVVQESVLAASDQRESMALTQQVFKSSTADVEAFASSTTDAFSKTDALSYAAKFGTAFQAVGMTLDETTDKSEALVTLAGDLASAFNTSAAEAGDALRSGLMGEAEPMRKFGVFLTETAVAAKAASMGMVRLGGELTASQKVAARYAIIMEQTADSQGMFGRDTESLADKQKLLAANVEDLSAKLGSVLTPVLVNATGAMNQFIGGIDYLLNHMGDTPDPAIASEYAAWRDKMAESFGQLTYAEQEALLAAQEAATGIGATWDHGSAGVNKALGTVSTAAGRTAEDVQKAAAAMKSDFGSLASYMLGYYTADITRAFDIEDARTGISADNAEAASLRKKLASGSLTRQEAADVTARLAELDRETAAHYAKLAETGTLSQKDYEAWRAVLVKLAAGTKGAVHAAYVAAIEDIDNLRNAAKAPVNVTVVYKSVVKGNNSNPTKSAGGNTFPMGGLSWVGEQGKELVYVPPGGQVFSNADSMRIAGGGTPARAGGGAGGGGGGGVTVNVYGHIVGPSGVDELMDMMATRLRLDGK